MTPSNSSQASQASKTSQAQPQSQPKTGLPYEVLVCTYNGGRYIDEQLASILNQRPAPQRLIVSDDGSTDETLSRIEKHRENTTIPIEIRRGPGKGIIQNLLSALADTRAPYVFLADQDDIWLDNKAALFAEQMSDSSEPHLIFSDALVWHPHTDHRRSFWQLDGLNPDNAKDPRKLAFHNAVQGASACINQALIRKVQHHPDIVMHDWWLGLIASGTGRVSVIQEPTLLYRQHGGNQIGCRSQRRRQASLFQAFKKKRADANRLLHQTRAYAELYGQELPAKHRAFFQAYLNVASKPLPQRLCFLFKWRPQRKNSLRTLTLWLGITLIRCRDSAYGSPTRVEGRT